MPRSPGMKKQEASLSLLVAAGVGIANLAITAVMWFPPLLYQRDLISEYLLAKALLAGINPYQPLPVIAGIFGVQLPAGKFPHPTPHPPVVAVLVSPLGLFSYQQATIGWWVIEVIGVYAIVRLVNSRLKIKLSPGNQFLLTLALFAWIPLMDELLIGQLMILVALLLLLAWGWLSEGREAYAGMALGLALCVKMMGWPILIFLILRRRWIAVTATLLIIIGGNLIALGVIGSGPLVYYYTQVGNQVAKVWRTDGGNFSLYGLIWRWLGDRGTSWRGELVAKPFLTAPELAAPLAFILPAAVVAVGIWLAAKARSFDTAFAVLVIISLPVSPVAWSFYLIPAVVPIVIAGFRLWQGNEERGISAGTARIGIAAIILLCFPQTSILMHLPSTLPLITTLGASWVGLRPLLALILLTWLVLRLDQKAEGPTPVRFNAPLVGQLLVMIVLPFFIFNLLDHPLIGVMAIACVGCVIWRQWPRLQSQYEGATL